MEKKMIKQSNSAVKNSTVIIGLAVIIGLICALSFSRTPVFAQEIITAERYMETVSNHYSGVRDFEAQVAIRVGNSDMAGVISYVVPNLLRLEFSRPANQVILFNGEALIIHVPDQRVVLHQELPRRARGAGTSAGLSMLRNNFLAAYEQGPNPVLLEGGGGERVIRLRLTRRHTGEPFREIILSVNPDTRLIRRMEGRTVNDTLVRFDFTGIRVNQGIPEQRFIYDTPVTAGTVQNFLFRDIE